MHTTCHNKIKMIRTFLITLLTFSVLSCAQQHYPNTVSRTSLNQVIQLEYGKVLDVQQVDVESTAATGAILGGILGLASGRGHSGESKIIRGTAGAVIGGATEKALTGSQKAYAYTIRKLNGVVFKVITENTGLLIEDCISIETTRRTTFLTRVENRFCKY